MIQDQHTQRPVKIQICIYIDKKGTEWPLTISTVVDLWSNGQKTNNENIIMKDVNFVFRNTFNPRGYLICDSRHVI